MAQATENVGVPQQPPLEPPVRYASCQRNRTILHPSLVQKPSVLASEQTRHSPQHCFVVCADPQLGMTRQNQDWAAELEYGRQAVRYLNSMPPSCKPKFVCICGDLIDMEASFYRSKPHEFSPRQCREIQEAQRRDFQSLWNELDPEICLVCLCGNHDIGNRPTPETIASYKAAFGDDYLAWWVNGTYNIVLNTTLFHDPTSAMDAYEAQFEWLQQRLEYAHQQGAAQVFCFGHHPWFLYHETEDANDMPGHSPMPLEWGGPQFDGDGFADSYFHIPLQRRQQVLDLFQKYPVHAAFAGHFHQNVLAETSWGMKMIVTASLSLIFQSTGKPSHQQNEEINTRGLRVVQVSVDTTGGNNSSFSHYFVPIPAQENDDHNDNNSKIKEEGKEEGKAKGS